MNMEGPGKNSSDAELKSRFQGVDAEGLAVRINNPEEVADAKLKKIEAQLNSHDLKNQAKFDLNTIEAPDLSNNGEAKESLVGMVQQYKDRIDANPMNANAQYKYAITQSLLSEAGKVNRVSLANEIKFDVGNKYGPAPFDQKVFDAAFEAVSKHLETIRSFSNSTLESPADRSIH